MLFANASRLVVSSLALIGLSACGGIVEDAGQTEPIPAERIGTATAKSTLPPLPSDGLWHWYDIPGTTCLDNSKPQQNGKPTGMGISVPAGGGNGKLLIWMEGGGFCFDATTCVTPFPIARKEFIGATDFVGSCVGSNPCVWTAGNVIAADTFSPVWSCSLFSPPLPNCGKAESMRGLWDRSPGTVNPFRNYTFVYIPYCTGDLHQGNRVDPTTGLQFVGHQNFVLDAQALHQVFPNPPAVVLGGRSAGGDGAFFNYRALRGIYTNPLMPVTVISDSGLPLWTGTPANPLDPNSLWIRQGYWLRRQEPSLVQSYVEDSFASAWGLAGTVSPTVIPFFTPGTGAPIYPQQSIFVDAAGVNPLVDRFGVIGGSNDLAIPLWLNLQTNGSLPSVGEGLIDFATNVVLTHPNVHLLTVSSTIAWNSNFLPWNQHHVFLNDDVTVWGPQVAGGSGVLDFLTNPTQLGITP
jgi:hypothetical protein